MKRIVYLMLLLSASAFSADLIPYGKIHNFDICLYDFATGIALESAITEVDGDITVVQSGTEGSGEADRMTDNGICYTYQLLASETDTARVQVIFADAAGDVWMPTSKEFYTFGHPSAGVVSLEPYRFAAVADDTTAATTSTDLTSAADCDTNTYDNHVLRIYDTSAATYYETVISSCDTNEIASHAAIPATVVSGDGLIVMAEKRSIITVSNGRVAADAELIEGSDATDQINAAADASMVTYGLDHIFSTTIAGSDVVDDSFAALLVADDATADFDTFDNTTDSLEAQANTAATAQSDLDTITGTNGVLVDDDAITAAKIAADAITASEVAADAIGAAEAGFLTDSTGFQGADVAAILTDTGTTLDDLVDDLESRLGTPSDLGGGATVAANLSDIEGQTDDIGVAGAGLTALATAAALATVDTNVDDIETDTADMQPKLGTYSDLGSGATLSGNLEDMRDDGTAVFSRTTDSLQAIADSGGGGPTAEQIVDEWETQSQADPTGFHVNVLEVAGTAQTGNDNGADINAILTDTGTTLDDLVDDLESRLGTPSDLGSGATVAANLADIEGQTDDIGAAGAGLTEAGGTGDQLTALATQASVDTIEGQTDDIGVAGAGLTAINLPDQTMNITGDITGNLSGSVGSVTGLTNATVSNQMREDLGALRCTINVGNNTNNTTSLPCVMTDPAGNAWTGANDALNNKRLNLITVATPAPYQGDFAFISDTVWDGVNSELVLTISPALSGALEDGDIVEIVP